MRTAIYGLLSVVLMIAAVGPRSQSVALAQAGTPFGYVVSDVTREADCLIIVNEYATIEAAPEDIIAEWVETCPSGSVLETQSVDSELMAAEFGGTFVASTGSCESDRALLRDVKSSLSASRSGSSNADRASA